LLQNSQSRWADFPRACHISEQKALAMGLHLRQFKPQRHERCQKNSSLFFCLLRGPNRR
jgi:hypothetical protein